MFGSDFTPLTFLLAVLSALFGAVCGSFAALVADRVPRGESIVEGRSACRQCGLSVAVRDLVPILSWLVLRGRCRTCRSPIGWSSLVAELATAFLFVLCAVRIDEPVALVAHWVLCTALVCLSVVDVLTMRLPRRIIHATAMLAVPLLTIASIMDSRPGRMTAAIVGSLAALAAMAFLYVASAGRLGDGDVRLSPLLGLYLGWKEISAVYSGFFLAFVLGSVVGLVVIAVRPAGSTRAIPFGPFLALGTMATVLFDIDFL